MPGTATSAPSSGTRPQKSPDLARNETKERGGVGRRFTSTKGSRCYRMLVTVGSWYDLVLYLDSIWLIDVDCHLLRRVGDLDLSLNSK